MGQRGQGEGEFKSGLGFREKDLGSRVSGLRFSDCPANTRTEDAELRALNLRCRVWCLGFTFFRLQGFRVQGLGCKVRVQSWWSSENSRLQCLGFTD